MLAQATRHGAAEPVAVLYPDLGDPFRRIFTEIIDGIEDQSRQPVHGYAIGAGQDAGELAGQLKRAGTKVVIALGRQGIHAATGIEYPTVISAVSTVADLDKQAGILLAPDPQLLFAQLKGLVPGARRVYVIYNPANYEWLIKLAREAARANGLELVALEARDLASAARQYETVFANADGRRDAVWLPPDTSTVDEATTVAIALREAWNRNIPVFSSNLLHVKRGVLFALFPDNLKLGKSLAGLANAALAGEAKHGIQPLREVRTALNLRTAGHIGLNVGQKQVRGFDIVYSEP
jgi:putative ABC transport system substrate-binding protein